MTSLFLKALRFMGARICADKRMRGLLVVAWGFDLINTASNVGSISVWEVFYSIHRNVTHRPSSGDDSIPLIDDYGIFVIAAALFSNKVFPRVRDALIDEITASMQKRLSGNMVKKCFDLELSIHQGARIGETSKLLMSNYTTVEGFVPSFYGKMVSFLFDTISVSIALGFIAGEEAAAPIISGLVCVIVAYGFSKASSSVHQEALAEGRKAHGMIVQAIRNYRVAHLYGRVGYETQRVESILSGISKLKAKAKGLEQASSATQNVIAYAGLFSAIAYTTLYQQVEDIAALVATFYILFYYTMRLEEFTGSVGVLTEAVQDISPMVDFFNRLPAVRDSQNAEELPESQYPLRVSFKNVFFRYSSSTGDVLKNITFSIEPGKKVAFVGATGIGKSTLVNLLLRFYSPRSGEIYLGETQIENFTLASLRLFFTVVDQSGAVFNATIFENIKYGRANATNEEVEHAATVAGLMVDDDGRPRDFSWLSSEAGEDGKRLSGGERQRVLIARAILKGGMVLILDEPTSSLDPITGSTLQGQLARLSSDVSVLLITHKLYTLRSADMIHYIANGEIVESGVFSELVSKTGSEAYFANQLRAQCKEMEMPFDEFLNPAGVFSAIGADTSSSNVLTTNYRSLFQDDAIVIDGLQKPLL